MSAPAAHGTETMAAALAEPEQKDAEAELREEPPNRLNRWVERWGVKFAALFGAVFLIWGLGDTGLWEPWEMDRADLARTLVEPPVVPVALGSDASDPTSGLQKDLVAAADEAGVVLRIADPPRKGARGVAAGARTLQETLATAKREVVGGVVLDLDLMVKDLSDANAWNAAGGRLHDAIRYASNAHVILVTRASGAAPHAVAEHATRALRREQWRDTARAYRLPQPIIDAPEIAQAIESQVTAEGPDPAFVVLAQPTQATLAEALEASASEGAWTVRFKDNGETKTVAPLKTWSIAFAYSVMGATELSTRLPGALFGLATLFLLLWLSQKLWGPRVATLAGLGLATTPLFFAQARSAVGEMPSVLALTLVGGAVLLHGARKPRHVVWMLAVGLVLGFLSDGLSFMAIATGLVVGYGLITGATDKRSLMLGAGTLAAFGLAALFVYSGASDGFAGQFRFEQPLFSAGPTAYTRNFDLIIHMVGFGSFPWSPFYVIAFGGLVFYATKQHDPSGVTMLLWFAVPVLMTMILLKNAHQFIWIGVPAGALGVAVFLDRLLVKRKSNTIAALLFLVMAVILLTELATSPRPLSSFLTFDPPFAKEGSLRYPETVGVPGWAKAIALISAALVAMYFCGTGRFFFKAVRFFRRPLPTAITIAASTFLFGALWLIRTLGSYSTAMRLDEANALSVAQRKFASLFLASSDPLVILAWLTLAVLGVVLALRFIFYRPVGAFVERLAGRVGSRLSPQLAFLLAGIAWTVLGISMWVSVGIPDGYWGEVLGGTKLAIGAVAFAGLYLGLRRGLKLEPGTAGIFLVGCLGLWLGTRFGRDAMLMTWYSVTFAMLGGAFTLAGLLPTLWRSGVGFSVVTAVLAPLSLLALALPLIDRYDAMLPLLYAEGGEDLLAYLAYKSRLSWLLYLTVAGLLINRYWETIEARLLGGRLGQRAVDLGKRGILAIDRSWTMAAALLVLGVGFSAAVNARIFPELSYNVSQKHIVDTYRTAEGLDDDELGDDIFTHGSFGSADRRNANFYTNQIPEIRDRTTALKVLLAERDQAPAVETAQGTDVRVVKGWDPENAGPDGKRKYPAEVGLATAVGQGTLTDSTKQWKPDSLTGQVLVDSEGKTYPIVGNDATTVRLETPVLPTFSPTDTTRNLYAIDSPDAPVHGASAMQPERTYFLMPAESFSSINHAFRKLSGGRHIPVIDGRSYRVLLTASWLAEGEENQNRYARHTLSRRQFDNLDDPLIVKAPPGGYLVNFDDKIWVVGLKVTPAVSRGEQFTITTYFEAKKPMRSSWKIFMHIDKRGSSNRIHSDHWPLDLTAGDEEDKRCTGCYRTDHWLPGDVIVDEFERDVPVGTPSGTQDIWMGFFRPSGGKRMDVKDWDKQRAAHDGGDRARIGSFQVR